ncbi:PREDICTED: uncharacterized protein LOC104733844 [Camelina sativa]|uniref:Uncharacterized protein LOC104733844 n=1 Tax=Camelina sativa TaxID=90675 RepID=A0ABM0V6L8_CAMSA|nr:PREDICTED: uncharacterized protein LOC104733844 [Camelina sativa]
MDSSTTSQLAVTTTVTNPYSLSSSDNPGSLISLVVLKEDNYPEWATELRNSLQAKQKLGFINGSTPKPAANPELAQWLAANSMIVGWIRTSIDPRIRSTVSFISEASTLWESLRVCFSVGNGVCKQVLKDEIALCKQDGQPVLEYYERLSKLWEELQNYKSSRVCRCEAAPDAAKEREDDQIHQFLFGLDLPRFSHIRSKITDEDPLPSLNQVYSRVIREEQNLDVARLKETTKPEAIGSSVHTEQPSKVAAVSVPKTHDRQCTHCHRQGHDVSECFLLHGFPDWYYEQKGTTRSTAETRDSSSRFDNKCMLTRSSKKTDLRILGNKELAQLEQENRRAKAQTNSMADGENTRANPPNPQLVIIQQQQRQNQQEQAELNPPPRQATLRDEDAQNRLFANRSAMQPPAPARQDY